MSGIPQTKNWQNPYDNSDLVMENEVRDIAMAYSNFDAMRAEREYLDTLKKRSDMLGEPKAGKVYLLLKDGDGKVNPTLVDAKYIISPPSEFEETRLNILMRLNDPLKTPPADLKQRMAEFETDSVFELSSKMANYILDKKRKDNVYKLYNLKWSDPVPPKS